MIVACLYRTETAARPLALFYTRRIGDTTAHRRTGVTVKLPIQNSWMNLNIRPTTVYSLHTQLIEFRHYDSQESVSWI